MFIMRIATLAGSLRTGSYNRKLLALAEEALQKTQVEIDHLDLRDFPLPLYDGDIEEQSGLPQNAWTLKARLAAAHGVIIASPEYNVSIPGALKNAIDWTSRGGSNPWAGKVIGLMGASNGPWGTQRMMPHLRASFQILNAHVIPQQINVREAPKVWDESGMLLDDKLPAHVEKFITEFLRVVHLLKSGEISS
jgi:chromate reductase, NAD(P)H dehydrogenase (quinone)